MPGTEADQVSSAAARTPPSTRAGGQDDVSLNKLPQIITFDSPCFLGNRSKHYGHRGADPENRIFWEENYTRGAGDAQIALGGC